MFFSSQKDPTSFDRLAAAMLHGKGYDRWFDKSFTLVVTKNGRVRCFLIYLYLLEILSGGLNFKVGRSKPPLVLTSGFNRLLPPWSILPKVVNTGHYWSILFGVVDWNFHVVVFL